MPTTTMPAARGLPDPLEGRKPFLHKGLMPPPQPPPPPPPPTGRRSPSASRALARLPPPLLHASTPLRFAGHRARTTPPPAAVAATPSFSPASPRPACREVRERES
uniref:Uncharacterized protein n=1 Tax=Oryza barthii TaxID=65489 RepID=A0A0D3ENE4_9ORYZ